MVVSPIHAQLMTGERLLWSGRPAQGLLLTAQDALMIPFSLMWGGFAFFWEATVIATDAPWFFKLWGVPFVCVGLYMIVGRFVADAWLRSGTCYAVTDRRVLILRESPFHSFVALDLAGLSDMRVSRGWGDRGTIRFGDEDWSLFRRSPTPHWSPSLSRVPQFLAIPDVEGVYATIERARMRG